MLKRLVSSIVGILLLVFVMISNNDYVFSIAVTVVALLGLFEFYHALQQKGFHPVSWVGYILTLFLAFIPCLEPNYVRLFLFVSLPITLFILFIASIWSKLKINIVDIGITMLGIIYVTFLFSILIFTRQMKNGNYYIWFIFGGAWMTDVFAYLVGITLGKHKFSEISPKKSIEGCVGGIIGSLLFFIGYTYYLNSVGMELNYLWMGILGIITSIIAQIGDFAASSIKRFCEIKDYGNIMPGHGGVLDRFDSILFIAPLIYVVFQLI